MASGVGFLLSHVPGFKDQNCFNADSFAFDANLNPMLLRPLSQQHPHLQAQQQLQHQQPYYDSRHPFLYPVAHGNSCSWQLCDQSSPTSSDNTTTSEDSLNGDNSNLFPSQTMENIPPEYCPSLYSIRQPPVPNSLRGNHQSLPCISTLLKTTAPNLSVPFDQTHISHDQFNADAMLRTHRCAHKQVRKEYERRRRFRIKTLFDKLHRIVPGLDIDYNPAANKVQILECTIAYLQFMRQNFGNRHDREFLASFYGKSDINICDLNCSSQLPAAADPPISCQTVVTPSSSGVGNFALEPMESAAVGGATVHQ